VTKAGWKAARKIRVALSLSVLSLVSLIFLDPWHIAPRQTAVYLTALEIIPGLLKLVVAGGIVSGIGFAAIALITLSFGRVYCSTVCPVGTLQDITIHFAKKINRQKRFKYYSSPQWLQYSIALIGIGSMLLAGSMIIGDLLEPFSNYGRLMTNIALQPLLLLNNLLAAIFTHFEVYFFYDIQLHVAEIGTLLFTSIFFATVIYLSAAKGRFFCNSFCPAGAILSLISRVSIFKLVIKSELCNDCGACDRVCKAECIDSSARRIDFSMCVSCFNCLRSCPTSAIEYSVALKPRFKSARVEPATTDQVLQSRRELLRNIGIPAAALLLAPGIVESGFLPLPKGSLQIGTNKRQTISPPGSLGVAHFTDLCTACHLCVASCPSNVLRPSFLEYGMAGMSQPVMDYQIGYCNYDCVICGEVCPTGAIRKLCPDDKKLVQIGKSKFSKDDCIVVSKKKDCAACSEHCPTKAVHTIPYEEGLFLPEVDDEICIGCGACEHVCPATPRKAIHVDANIVHQTAKKPKIQQMPKKVQNPANDFPF